MSGSSADSNLFFCKCVDLNKDIWFAHWWRRQGCVIVIRMGHRGDCISLCVSSLTEQILSVRKATPLQTQTVGAQHGRSGPAACLPKCSVLPRKFSLLSGNINHTCHQCGFLGNNRVCALNRASMGAFLCYPRLSHIVWTAPLIAMTDWPLGWSPSGSYSFHWLDLCLLTLLQTLPSHESSLGAGRALLSAGV